MNNTATAQVSVFDEERRGSVYFGVGGAVLNNFGASTIHVDQGSLNNAYVINKLAGSSSGSGGSFTPLQLSYRLGYFFTYRQNWGIELNYDGSPYYVKDGQKVAESGTMGGIRSSQNLNFSAANGYSYHMNADLILFNAVRRFGVFLGRTHKVRFDVLAKAGVGPVMPKLTTTLNGVSNSPKMAFAGVNGGAELAARVTLFRYMYLELAGKYDYASFSGMKVNDGTVKQNLVSTAVIASVGITFPTTRHHPLFEKGVKKRRVITLKPMYPGIKE